MFFDACGIDYQYEPEGFNLGGRYYLPDFYLPKFKFYVEVKPKTTHEDFREHEKLCCDFRNHAGMAILLLHENDPAESTCHELFAWSVNESSAGSADLIGAFADVDGNVVFATDGQGYEAFLNDRCSVWSPLVKPHNEFGIKRDTWWNYIIYGFDFENREGDIVRCAAFKARQARFEHGEKPNAR